MLYCSDYDVLKEKADTLESEYDKLNDLHEECTELGADEEDYMQDITNSFQECMKLYFSSGKAEKERQQIKEAAPLKTVIERDFSRIESTLERIPGHTLSFKEEQELGDIKDNLHYDAEKNCWVTSYPWIIDPYKLPDN